jgi:phosphatidylserine synthase
MAALVAVLDGSARMAIIWLLVAQLIDGIDGPLARRLLPDEATTKFDGYVLDLVIDFVTCVLVPAAWFACARTLGQAPVGFVEDSYMIHNGSVAILAQGIESSRSKWG